jgi:adenylate cyclase
MKMKNKSMPSAQVEEFWRSYLTTGDFDKERRQRRFFRLLPGYPRCVNCYAPFHGVGSPVVRLLYGKRPSKLNPKLCNICEEFASDHQGGADIELSLLFMDVRGSTALAEQMTPMEFSQLINRFYTTASQILVSSDALIDKIIGDQVAGMYVPGFAGPDHAQQALRAAQRIMKKTGHDDTDGPWIPLGAGVHTGIAFVGSLGSEDGVTDITVLGDAPNTAARLSSAAQVGEILLSNATCEATGLGVRGLERRQLELKGKSQPVSAFVLKEYDDLPQPKPA